MTHTLRALLLSALTLVAACGRSRSTPPPAPAGTRIYAGTLDGESLEVCAIDGQAVSGLARLAWAPAAARQLARAMARSRAQMGDLGMWEATPTENGTLRLAPPDLDVHGEVYVRVHAVTPPPWRPNADGSITVDFPSPPVRVVALIDVTTPPPGRCP